MANTVLWARNPHNYIREVVAGGVVNVCWDWGLVHKKGIDPFAFSSTWFPQRNWRSLTVARWGSIENDSEHPYKRPLAVHPTWTYGEQSLSTLEDYIKHGAQLLDLNELRSRGHRPRKNQRSCVVITNLPDMKLNVSQRFMALLAELQQENPQCEIHIHGLYAFEKIVGGIFASADFEVRALAAQGQVILPNGKQVKTANFESYAKSFARFGYTTADLATSPSKRCTYNVKSYAYAAANWHNPDSMAGSNMRRPTISETDFDDLLRGKTLSVPKVKSAVPLVPSGDPLAGDKFYCDSCSYSKTCRLFRTGSICAVPDSESDELARHFKTRDSSLIIEGLGKLMEGNVQRYVDGKKNESADGELDPHVTRIGNDLFKQGVQLAKLVDPSLRTSAVAVNIGANNASISVGGPETKHQLAARMINELEAGGIPRKHITEELVRGAMTSSNLGEYVRREAVKFALPEYVDVEEA